MIGNCGFRRFGSVPYLDGALFSSPERLKSRRSALVDLKSRFVTFIGTVTKVAAAEYMKGSTLSFRIVPVGRLQLSRNFLSPFLYTKVLL